jgi:hypothetical protein
MFVSSKGKRERGSMKRNGCDGQNRANVLARALGFETHPAHPRGIRCRRPVRVAPCTSSWCAPGFSRCFCRSRRIECRDIGIELMSLCKKRQRGKTREPGSNQVALGPDELDCKSLAHCWVDALVKCFARGTPCSDGSDGFSVADSTLSASTALS